MVNVKILVVEDESIVAKDIQGTLTNLGYDVPYTVPSGEKAIEKTLELHPDLVLMDIRLKGSMDGIESAKQIRERFNIPVVYLTAYTDDATLKRAKITEPYAYILKPFEAKELHINVEMALYKHKMEKELKERERWFATTLKSIDDAVITTDTGGLITFMNQAAEILTGWKYKDVVGKDLTEVFNIIDEHTRTSIERPVEKALRNDDVTDFVNHTILIGRNATEIYIDYGAVPIKDDTGSVMGVVFAFRDITERKQVEEQLRVYRESLEELVRKRTKRIHKLERQRTEIEKQAATGKMAAFIAHEINNPLAGIKNSFLLIKDAIPVSHKYYRYVNRIEKEVERVASIVRQTFNLYKPQREKPQEFDVVVVVRDVMAMLSGNSNKKDVKLDLDVHPSSAVVTMPEGLLRQVLYNIIQNAIDASPTGSLVETAIKIVDDVLTITVSDHGSGIPDELLSRVFEPFFSTKGDIAAGGMGLGLSISKGIVEAFGGSLDFRSEKDKGTVFIIEMPVGVTKEKEACVEGES
jgi:PAS domain S-box-containing protein